MTEFNENNKDFSGFPEKLPKNNLNFNSLPIFLIIMGVFSSLIMGSVLFITYIKLGGEHLYSSNCILNAKWHMIYPFIVGSVIGIFISLGVWKSRYVEKKTILKLTILSIFFAYLLYNLAGFVKDALPDRGSFDLMDFLGYVQNYAGGSPLKFEFPMGIIDDNPINRKMYTYTNPIRSFFYTITLEKIDPIEDLPVMINFQVWIIEFIVTFLVAWIIISLTYSKFSIKVKIQSTPDSENLQGQFD